MLRRPGPCWLSVCGTYFFSLWDYLDLFMPGIPEVSSCWTLIWAFSPGHSVKLFNLEVCILQSGVFLCFLISSPLFSVYSSSGNPVNHTLISWIHSLNSHLFSLLFLFVFILLSEKFPELKPNPFYGFFYFQSSFPRTLPWKGKYPDKYPVLVSVASYLFETIIILFVLILFCSQHYFLKCICFDLFFIQETLLKYLILFGCLRRFFF